MYNSHNELRRITFHALLLLALLCSVLPAGLSAHTALAVSPDIVISQVYGGGGNAGATLKNDFIELFNRGTAAVDMTGWSVQYASSGGFTWQRTNLTGTLQPGKYYLVQEAAGAGGSVDLPTPDATGSIAMSATSGKVALVTNQTLLTCGGSLNNCFPNAAIKDFVGYGSSANNFEGTAPTAALSNTTAALRNNNGCTDTDDNAADFTVGAPTPRNTASPAYSCGGPTNPSGIGLATPNAVFPGDQSLLTVAATPGANPPSTGLTVSGDLSAIGGSASQAFFDDGSNGDLTAGDNTFSFLALVQPATTPGAKILPTTVSDAQARSGSAPISLTVRPPVVAIHDIQGASHWSSYDGDLVSTRGVVTAIRSNGFYMQDPNPDTSEATSEAIFVFTSSSPGVTFGDAVLVSGTVLEFRAGGLSSNNLTITEFSGPGLTVTIESNGNPLPAPTVVGFGGRMPPGAVIEDDASGSVETSGVFDPATDGIDFYESLEAMLLQVNNAVAVGPTNNFGETAVVGDFGAYAGLDTNRGGVVIQPTDFNPERIILDDVITASPVMNTGDSLDNPVVGVLDYSFGNFKLNVKTPVPAVVAGGLARESTLGPSAYQLSIGTFNVENLNPGDPQAKFDELAGLIFNNLKAPDILAVEEIQDNTGPTNNGVVAADQTYARLIAAIQAAGGPTYDFRQVDPANNQDGGQPGGNIRQGFLFRSDRVSFVDRPGGDAVTPTGVSLGVSGPQLTLSPGRIDPTNSAFNASRKPLAGEFVFKGDKVFVVANHFNSKGGDDPLFGVFQPPTLSSEVQRLQQAQVVNDFIDSILALDSSANVVVLGDLNDFQFSSPLATVKGGVLFNLMDTLPSAEQYTYVFDGNSQVLDHTLVSQAPFNQPFAFDVVHVNAEFATQASDHDPQVANLCVDATPPVISGTLTPGVIWPPNHKYKTVNATVSVVDNADPQPLLSLVSVTSNEPDDGLGDGDTPDDIVIVDKDTFELRAERSGTGTDRLYTVTYQAFDACGNSSLASGTITVPHADPGEVSGGSPIVMSD